MLSVGGSSSSQHRRHREPGHGEVFLTPCSETLAGPNRKMLWGLATSRHRGPGTLEGLGIFFCRNCLTQKSNAGAVKPFLWLRRRQFEKPGADELSRASPSRPGL